MAKVNTELVMLSIGSRPEFDTTDAGPSVFFDETKREIEVVFETTAVKNPPQGSPVSVQQVPVVIKGTVTKRNATTRLVLEATYTLKTPKCTYSFDEITGIGMFSFKFIVNEA